MIRLDHVAKSFGPHAAVADISLDVQAGEFLTLLGPSGCGKTTLLRMISGFEVPDTGRVFLADQDVTDLPPHRRNVNQVFQNYALFPHLTVGQNIAFGLKTRGLPRGQIAREVAKAVESVSLTGMADRKPAQLSGGQRQRVALARALVCEPKVLLLDEPLAALDAKLRRTMQAELKSLQARVGITFIFVTHDQDEALALSDRVAVLNQGKIEQLDTPRELYHRPATAFVAGFVGQINLLPATVVGRQGDAAVAKLADGSQVLVASAAAVDAQLLLMIRPEEIRPSNVPGPNVLEGSVVDRTFKGAMEQVVFQTVGGLRLTAVASVGAEITGVELPVARLLTVNRSA